MITPLQRKGGSHAAALEIPRDAAITAKRALQSALEHVNRVHSTLPVGGPADRMLDQAERELCVGITLLRDADRTGYDADFVARAEDSREVTCPNCGHVFRTRAKAYASCPSCRKSLRVDVQQRRVKREDRGQRTEVRGKK